MRDTILRPLYGQGMGSKVALITDGSAFLGRDAGFLCRPCRTEAGGRRPIGLLEDGDITTIDAAAGTLDMSMSEAELAARAKSWKPRRTDYQSGAIWKYAQAVGPARDGAVTHPGAASETH